MMPMSERWRPFARAFECGRASSEPFVFTEEFDSWWPRTHHIGKAPLESMVLGCSRAGRCFGRHADGTECDWGAVLEWDPPRRFVLA